MGETVVAQIEDGFYILLTHEELSGFPEIKAIDRNGKTNLVVYNTSDGVGDEKRLLIALLSDTGKRLPEALGLLWRDVNLDHGVSSH